MPRFYFDFHEESGIAVDKSGEEFPDAVVARQEALRTLGQVVRDMAEHHSDCSLAIEVRGPNGLILTVEAQVKTTVLKS